MNRYALKHIFINDPPPYLKGEDLEESDEEEVDIISAYVQHLKLYDQP